MAKPEYTKYGKLEAARVKLVLAMNLLEEARINIGEATTKIEERHLLQPAED